MADIRDQGIVIPVVEEVATIATRTVQTDHVRVRTVVEDRQTEVTAKLSREDIHVERRVVDREVATAPEPYQEGDCLIVPIVEERLVVEKRLFVIEEIVVRRTLREDEVVVPTTLKTMRAIIDQDTEQQR